MAIATYKNITSALTDILDDFSILAGDKVGDEPAESWQFYASRCSHRCAYLSELLERAALGKCESFISFPSPDEILNPEER